MRKSLKKIGVNKSIKIVAKFVGRNDIGLVVRDVVLIKESEDGNYSLSNLLTEHVTIIGTHKNHNLVVMTPGDLLMCTCKIRSYTRGDGSIDYGLTGFNKCRLKDVKIIKPVMCNNELYFMSKHHIHYDCIYRLNKNVHMKYRCWTFSHIDGANINDLIKKNIKVGKDLKYFLN